MAEIYNSHQLMIKHLDSLQQQYIGVNWTKISKFLEIWENFEQHE